MDYRLLERMALENCGMTRHFQEDEDAASLLKGFVLFFLSLHLHQVLWPFSGRKSSTGDVARHGNLSEAQLWLKDAGYT